MKILLLEPFYTGSHQTWAQGFQAHSQHHIEILSLQGRHWKWRMHGGAVSLAHKFLDSNLQPDLILATSMLDLTIFLALTRHRTSEIPIAIYFHENQLTYPWSASDPDVKGRQDRHYGFINYTSALAADKVFFNSDFHKNSFLRALKDYLKVLPDHRELASVEHISAKSEVLSLGMDLQKFDAHKSASHFTSPIILWNHRWEYDKNPADFFRLMYFLEEDGIEYQMVVLGEKFPKIPSIFKEAKEKLAHRILHFGYAADFETYAKWLWQSDIAVTTSHQDFFGGSVVEAIYCDCHPVLPKRLAYPEHVATSLHSACFYEDFAGLCGLVKDLITKSLRKEVPFAFRDGVGKYDWSIQGKIYDERMEKVQRGTN